MRREIGALRAVCFLLVVVVKKCSTRRGATSDAIGRAIAAPRTLLS